LAPDPRTTDLGEIPAFRIISQGLKVFVEQAKVRS
jgi:hypothetical protein